MNPSFAEGHLFLAKVYLDLEQNLDEAVRLARKGIELRPEVRIRAAGSLRDGRRVFARRGVRRKLSGKRRGARRWSAEKGRQQ